MIAALRMLPYRPSVFALAGILAFIVLGVAECDDFSTYPKN